MHVLQVKASNPLLSEWKRGVLRRLHPAGALHRDTTLLRLLNPPLGYFPDFLTPYEALSGFEAGLEAILGTPKRRLRNEIERLDRTRPGVAQGVEGIWHGNIDSLKQLASSFNAYYRAAIAPVWPRLTAAFSAERAMRVQSMASLGVQRMLDGLLPAIRFDGAVLSFPFPSERDIYLQGRGLVLIPSYFKEEHTIMDLADTELPPVLVYPIDRQVRIATEAARTCLESLLGQHRTRILELAGSGMTGKEISRQLSVTEPAVSRHLSVLRGTGLLHGQRLRNTLRHTLTPLGAGLLRGGPKEPTE